MIYPRILAVLLLSLLGMQICAADLEKVLMPETQWFRIDHGDGLTSQLPTVSNRELLRLVREHRRELLARKAVLEQTVEDSSFGLKDVLVGVIVPGGLLYAAHRKLRHERARSELMNIVAQFDELAGDLSRLQAAGDEPRVAILRLFPVRE